MAIDVLFVQGAGEDVHEAWDRKLVESLQHNLGAGYRVRYPRMPDEADPKYATWKPAIIDELDAPILVGHSLGGTMLVHALAEHGVKFQALVLIAAPYIGEGGWPSDEITARTHFGLPAAPVLLFHGTADTTAPTNHVHLYARAIQNATVHVLEGRDHQLNNDLGEVARELQRIVPA